MVCLAGDGDNIPVNPHDSGNRTNLDGAGIQAISLFDVEFQYGFKGFWIPDRLADSVGIFSHLFHFFSKG